MKTLIFQATTGERVEVKVDIFSTNADLQVDGFDTRFTAMQIVDDAAAIKLGINLKEVEYRWMAMKNLATNLDLTLTVIDLNAKTGATFVENTAVASVDITPAAVSKSKAGGTTQQFTKTVLPAEANQSVVWSIAPAAAGLSINQSGLVTIGSGVTNDVYTVTAKAGSKTDTAALTVTS